MATTTRHLAAMAAVALLAVLAARPAAAETHDDCGMAQEAFSECTAYVVGQEPTVSPQCCEGLGGIRDLGHTALQRRVLCECILSEMVAAGKVQPALAAGVPAACKVHVGFIPTTPDFNCSAIP